jgi:hypothetical protein
MFSSLDGFVILPTSRPNHITTRLVDTVIFKLSSKPAGTSRKLRLELHIFPDASIQILCHKRFSALCSREPRHNYHVTGFDLAALGIGSSALATWLASDSTPSKLNKLP